VRSAEDSLHAATAQVGVAVASFFPDVSLSGTFGLRNTGTRYLLDWASHFYTFGPKVSIPIFEGGALVASVKLSRAQEVEAAINYRKTVLSALQDVEDALSALQADARRRDAAHPEHGPGEAIQGLGRRVGERSIQRSELNCHCATQCVYIAH